MTFDRLGNPRHIFSYDSNGLSEAVVLQYEYDSFANVRTLRERYNGGSTVAHPVAYDHANRVKSAFGQAFTWHGTGNFATFNGQSFTYDGTHPHALDKVNHSDRYDYDANGNMDPTRWARPLAPS